MRARGSLVKYGAHHRRATAAGCRSTEQYAANRERVALVIGALVRIGKADLLVPRTAERALYATLLALAGGSDPRTAEGAALHATLTRTPPALSAFIRRNRQWTRERIAAASDP
jgi:hypothetical protein